jgi:hypothetical protein
VAIGATYNAGVNGDYSGHVRVYNYSGGEWTQLGIDIDGEAADDQSGVSVSLSSDGSRVAIGAMYNAGVNGDYSGHVRVYNYSEGTWTQLGGDIDGEAESDYSGRSVSLSSDGSQVAIGAPDNDGNGSDSGHVRVFSSAPEINLKQSSTDIADGGSYDYGSKVSGTDTDVVFTIENTGMEDLTLTTPLTLGGADAGQYSIQAQPTSPIAGSGSTTFTVRFSPASAGSKTASIAIANNDSDENPYDLTLNGTGIAKTTPTVTTATASSITSTSASSGGDVTSDGGASVTARGVCWSTSANPTTGDSKTSDGSGTGSFTSSITGLSPNTTYHSRAYATNSVGTSYGADKTFTTAKAAPTVTTNAASSVGTTGATLNGTINASNESTTVTFEYGLTASYGTTVTADQSPVTGTADTAVSKAVTGLIPNTTYHYRVVGLNATGTSNGADKTFTTAKAASAVTTNAASSVGRTGATLNGTINANNESTTVKFEYGLTASYGTTSTTVTADQSPVSGSADTAVSKAVTGLTPNTTYHYRVVGLNATGATNGADMTFTTLTIDAVDPTISGEVRDPDGEGIAGVILTFSTNSFTSTDSDGNYSQTVPHGWSGTVNPQKDGYVFEPENRSYTDVIEDQTGGNFTGYPPPSVSITSPIFGSVLMETVVIEADASSVTGTSTSVTGISKVEFYIDNSKKGEDTLLPYEYSWDTTADSDGEHEIKVIAYNEKGQTAIDQVDVRVSNTQAENPVISGQVSDSENNGIAGVTVTFGLSGGVSTTDEDGFYSREVLYGWSGIVTLSKPAFTFEPAFRGYDGVISDQDNQDYYGESRPIVEISGDITEDIVWSADFYYVVTGDINVPEEVSLTLEPGAVVAFQEDTIMTVGGEFIALGTEEEPIVLMPESENLEGLNFYGEVISLSYCAISNVTGAIRIGESALNVSSADYQAADNSRVIRVDHCTFINNFNGIVITGFDSIRFENNIVKEADYGFEINLPDIVSGTESVVIKNNIFTQIREAVLMINNISGTYEISGNSFFNNGNWDVYFESGVNDRLDMRNNYWGTENAEDISDRIYDNNDDPSKGTVDFNPFLTEPGPDAPAQISALDISPSTPLPLGVAWFTLRFNCQMDMLQEAWVSFGRFEPYEDYTIEGSWDDERTWSGIYGVTGTTDAGVHTIKVSRAKGADKIEVTNEHNHEFEIGESVVLTLEASRKEERALIVTKEYGDINFLVENYADVPIERYVIYRKLQDGVYSVLKTIQESEMVNGQYSFYDTYLLKDEQYTYKVVAVNSKGVTVGKSNEKII